MFDLNSSSQIPLNEQIVEQTKLMIAQGILIDGDTMPSVRDLKCIFYGISFEKIKNIYEKSKEDSNGCGSNEPL